MISKGNNPIEEVDIRKLPYLQAIVKETLRLHQPVPFLLPPKAGKDMDIGGYTISKDAKVLKKEEKRLKIIEKIICIWHTWLHARQVCKEQFPTQEGNLPSETSVLSAISTQGGDSLSAREL
ncbi:hypothetical protein JHK82_034037 [Glycine max]|nr:hypothetical protein JHK82_034037 [Glycine max]